MSIYMERYRMNCGIAAAVSANSAFRYVDQASLTYGNELWNTPASSQSLKEGESRAGYAIDAGQIRDCRRREDNLVAPPAAIVAFATSERSTDNVRTDLQTHQYTSTLSLSCGGLSAPSCAPDESMSRPVTPAKASKAPEDVAIWPSILPGVGRPLAPASTPNLPPSSVDAVPSALPSDTETLGRRGRGGGGGFSFEGDKFAGDATARAEACSCLGSTSASGQSRQTPLAAG